MSDKTLLHPHDKLYFNKIWNISKTKFVHVQTSQNIVKTGLS